MSINNQHFVPLHSELRAALETKEAARHLRREPQTLRAWASKGSGPIKPIRIGGRLLWRTTDLRKALGITEFCDAPNLPDGLLVKRSGAKP
jgi:hypothetical protein